MSTTTPEPGLPRTAPGVALPGLKERAGAGVTWMSGGWKLFMRAPLMWVIAVVMMFVIAIVLSIIPVVGPVAFQVFQAVFFGGLMWACRSLEGGDDFELEHLFAGFRNRFGPLAIVGLLMFVGGLAIMAVFALFVGFSLLGSFIAGNPDLVLASVAESAGAVILGTLVMLALMVPLLAAYWFAPALVMLDGMKPLAAMKASFHACMRNFGAFLVYGVVMSIALVIAMIPFGLGLLVWIPLMATSTYVAYRRIFAPAPEVPAAAAEPI